MWHALFVITNAIALLGWVLLAFFPRKPLTYSAILYLGVALLCLTYTALMTGVVAGLIDPNPVGPATDVSFTSIAGIRGLFASDGGVVIGWTHYLAFDLFTGLWISRDADAKGFGRFAQTVILYITLMAGPIGLLIWLILREGGARRYARAQKAA